MINQRVYLHITNSIYQIYLSISAASGRESSGISMAFVEYFYIVFWISKDTFWSWGTGDLSDYTKVYLTI